ncbi:hypothetical protein ACVDG5_011390 [Mesorhizobium sp. ORM6]
MPDVVKVRAATNNEVAFLSWDMDEMIPGCLGFEIVRCLLRHLYDVDH